MSLAIAMIYSRIDEVPRLLIVRARWPCERGRIHYERVEGLVLAGSVHRDLQDTRRVQVSLTPLAKNFSKIHALSQLKRNMESCQNDLYTLTFG